ncbi:unnamed protein product, partial [Durusdinium trenchii]
WTPLHRAARSGHSEVAQRLVDAGADVDAQNNSGLTPWEVAKREGHETRMAPVLRPVQVGLLSGRTVGCDPEPSRTVRDLLEEAQSKLGTGIHHLVTSSGTTLKEHVTLQEAGIGYDSVVTAIALVPASEGRSAAEATSSTAAKASVPGQEAPEGEALEGPSGPSGVDAPGPGEVDGLPDETLPIRKAPDGLASSGHTIPVAEVSSPDPAVGCQSGELADARRSMQEEGVEGEGFEYAASDLVEQPAAQPVLHNVEEFPTAPFVKKIDFDWEEGRKYLDIELDDTAICLVRDDIVMMSSRSVHQSNSLGFEVLEDYDAPALPAGMVPMGPLLRLWPENVTFSEEVHVVMPVCRGAKNAWCTTDSGWKQVPAQIRQSIMITSLHHFCSMQPAGEPVEIKALGYIKQPSAKIVLAHIDCSECDSKLSKRENDPHFLKDFTQCRDPEVLDERKDGDKVELSQPEASRETIELKFKRFPFVSKKLSAQSGSFKVQVDDEPYEFQLDRDADNAEVARPRQHASPQAASGSSEHTSTGSAIHRPPEVRLKWEEPVVIEVDLSELLTKMDPGLYQVLAQERGRWHQVSEDLFLHIWTDANIARAQVAQRSLCLEHVEQVTSDLVRRICVDLGLAFSSDMAKKLTKIVRCKQVTDLRWYDIFRHRAFSTIDACAKRGASQILLVGVQPKMLNSITQKELRCLHKDLKRASEKKSFDFYHLLNGLKCPIDRLEEELQQWLRKDTKHQVVIVSCCEDDQEEAQRICKRLNEGLDVLEYVDALSPEEVMFNLSISAIKKVLTQLGQDGFTMPAEKFGQAMRMLGMSATPMKVSTPSIDILTLHDLLLEDLKNSATDPYNVLMKFLRLLDGDCKDTMSVAELKRFLGIGGMRSENELEATVSAYRQAEIPLSKLREALFDPESQQKLLNDQQTTSRISWAVADRNAFQVFDGPWSAINSGTKVAANSGAQSSAGEDHKDSVAVGRETGRISVPIPVAPANGKHLFLSGRFNDPKSKSYMRAVRDELEQLGVQTYMVEGQGAGGDFAPATIRGLYHAIAMVAFCTRDYGQKTNVGYETWRELKTAHERDIPIIPVQLCDTYPPEPPDEEGRQQNWFVLGPSRIKIKDVGSNEPARVAKDVQRTWLNLTRR